MAKTTRKRNTNGGAKRGVAHTKARRSGKRVAGAMRTAAGKEAGKAGAMRSRARRATSTKSGGTRTSTAMKLMTRAGRSVRKAADVALGATRTAIDRVTT